MNTIILKNGQEEVESLVEITMCSLNNLVANHPIAFYELVELCKDRDHRLFGNSGKVLKDLGLLQDDDTVHNSIKNIILSAIEGEGFNMRIVDPY